MSDNFPNRAGISSFLRRLLEKRDITDDTAIDEFLFPDYDRDLHDPGLLSGVSEAVARILKALDDAEKIKILSDFDADGIPAAVVLQDALEKLGASNLSVSIPHRNTEGFGLNDRVVDECIESGVALLMTLDCGMGDAPRIARARAAGIDVIVVDHHRPGADSPAEALAKEGGGRCIIVNPNADGDEYPNKHLCGAGVTYKLVEALIKELRQQNDPRVADIPVGWEKWLLDMVGIATLSDMVALTGENRALAHYGLKVLRMSHRPGIKALCTRARIRQHRLTEDDVVFVITPRINAASRMDEPEAAFKLLSAKTSAEADALAEHLDGVNNARKGAVAAMSKEIKAILAERGEIPAVVVVGNPHWRPGLLGLAATKIAETYDRPAFVWGQGEATTIKGSCRAGGSTDVMELMTEAKDLFLEFGGHTRSGGFSTTVANVMKLEDALVGAAEKLDSAEKKAPVLHDVELELSDVSHAVWRDIEKLSPFGMANPKPLFLFRSCTVNEAKPFGKEQQHTKLLFDVDGREVSAIQFFSSADIQSVRAGDTIDLLATMEEDAFSRKAGIRLRIVEVTPKG